MKQTFLIEIVDQQNASWQGTVQWINEGKKTPFRSALELIRLLDSTMESISSANEESAEENNG